MDGMFDPEIHHRRSVRLGGYDYSAPGTYFVTICAHGKQHLFGEVVDGEMVLSRFGKFVSEEWLRSERIRTEIQMDAYVVMPNHLHGIVRIADIGAHGRAPLPRAKRQPRSLASFLAGFKSASASRINQMRGTPGVPVWQRNYFEHIVRDPQELAVIREYISTNPLRWAQDPEFL